MTEFRHREALCGRRGGAMLESAGAGFLDRRTGRGGMEMKQFVVALAALLAFGVVKAEKGDDKPIRSGGEWAVPLDAQGMSSR